MNMSKTELMGGGSNKNYGGKEGDWHCSECNNRNYAFRSLCNRCKKPRLIVDKITPPDSKWLPRVGDWICSGCSNNNYASREVCKKCGQSKEEAAMPTIAISGAQLPTYANYFSRMQGYMGSRMNYYSQWSNGDSSYKYGPQAWPIAGSSSQTFPYMDNPIPNHLSGTPPEGWRNGDWVCCCGFHNYASRLECKRCNLAPSQSGMPSFAPRSAPSDFFPTSGTKRLASEEFSHEWDNKRLNAGDVGGYFPHRAHERHPYQEQLGGPSYDQGNAMYSKFSCGDGQPVPQLSRKGANQWRDGDWMCANCSNHNFASRSTCNRCNTEKETAIQDASAA